MKFGVVVFPGSNCEQDCYHVIAEVLGEQAYYIWHGDRSPLECDCVVLPGGFSYGDYLRPGAMAKFSPVMNRVVEYGEAGGIVLGICNGFQILLEAGLLPGAMLRNRGLKFICDTVTVRVERGDTPFTRLIEPGRVLTLPINHYEGNYYADAGTLRELEATSRVLFRYCGAQGELGDETNPNGAANGIAGIINKAGNVLGMMPHPERRSEAILGGEDGMLIFRSIAEFIKGR